MVGPDAVYGSLTTWNGFFNLVSGAQFRGDMHFLSLDSVRAAWTAMPHVIDHLVSTSNVIFLCSACSGSPARPPRSMVRLAPHRARRHQRLFLRELPRRPVPLPAAHVADPGHRARDLARLGGEPAVEAVGTRASVVQFAALALPVLLLSSNWTSHDQSANRDGERLARRSSPPCPRTRSSSPTGTP
jgi:hypothetical protein